LSVLLTDASRVALTYICQNLRERDREEVFATRYDESPESLAEQTLMCGDFQWIAWRDGLPVASIGAYPAWPNVWTVWAFGTDDWPRVALTLTKHVQRFMIPALKNSGAHRAQCFALDTHHDARRWLVALGAKEGPRLDKFGKNGQTFVLYSWLHSTTG
jgi:hypothetical protein